MSAAMLNPAAKIAVASGAVGWFRGGLDPEIGLYPGDELAEGWGLAEPGSGVRRQHNRLRTSRDMGAKFDQRALCGQESHRPRGRIA